MENKEQGFKCIFSKPPAIWLSNVDTNSVENKNESASWDIVKNEVVGKCKECGRTILRRELGNNIDGARKDENGDWHCAFDYSSLDHKPVEMIRKETLSQSITSEDYRIKEKELREIQSKLNQKPVNSSFPESANCPICTGLITEKDIESKHARRYFNLPDGAFFGEGFYWHIDCFTKWKIDLGKQHLSMRKLLNLAIDRIQILKLAPTDTGIWLSKKIGTTVHGRSMPVSRALQLIREAEYHD